MTPTVQRILVIVALVVTAASCGGSSSESSTGASTPTTGAADSASGTDATTDDAATDDAAADEEVASSSSVETGTMTFGDETITFDSSLCYLQEQDAAAGGGKILFVVQAKGLDAAGDQVMIDVSRYDDDSMFAGDSISLVFGDPFTGGDSSWDASGDTGIVTLDGSHATADQLTFVNGDDLSETTGSFDIDC